jgi:hypothetical protein
MLFYQQANAKPTQIWAFPLLLPLITVTLLRHNPFRITSKAPRNKKSLAVIPEKARKYAG